MYHAPLSANLEWELLYCEEDKTHHVLHRLGLCPELQAGARGQLGAVVSVEDRQHCRVLLLHPGFQHPHSVVWDPDGRTHRYISAILLIYFLVLFLSMSFEFVDF